MPRHGNHIGERQRAPSVAARAVSGELVVVLMQAAEGAEVDHSATVARERAGRAAHGSCLRIQKRRMRRPRNRRICVRDNDAKQGKEVPWDMDRRRWQAVS